MSTKPTQRDVEQARTIWETFSFLSNPTKQIEIIAEALACCDAEWREKCKAFLDESGEPRKVLGTLPITKDGCFCGHGATLYLDATIRWNDKNMTKEQAPEFRLALAYESDIDPDRPPHVCWGGPDHDCCGLDELYSTREAAIAAEAARKEGV